METEENYRERAAYRKMVSIAGLKPQYEPDQSSKPRIWIPLAIYKKHSENCGALKGNGGWQVRICLPLLYFIDGHRNYVD